MSAATERPIQEVLESDEFDREAIDTLCERARTAVKDREAIEAFAKALAEETGSAASRKRGIALAAIGRYDQAEEALRSTKPSDPARLVLGRCYRELGRADEAMRLFQGLSPDGWSQLDIDLEIAGTALAAGDVEQALEVLNRNSRRGQDRADYHFYLGCALQAAGDVPGAAKAFQAAQELGEHPAAAFRLGRLADLYGDDEFAQACYERCLAGDVLYVNALLNLGVLHEDEERYEEAIECYSKVLRLDPTNERALLFLKDAQASTNMYIDEDLERRVDRRNQILETPVTDFELSVRSRNCLRKMGVRTLGDLAQCTEPELLSYKNFGETSLKEIKTILSSKGLRLGMGREAETRGEEDSAASRPHADAELLNRPIDELELSVRGRRCLERLDVHTVGGLIQCTEAELLACKNFGQTSLSELKSKLADLGISLKET